MQQSKHFIYSICIFLFLWKNSFAQETQVVEVSDSSLLEAQSYNLFPDADAVTLFDKGRLRFISMVPFYGGPPLSYTLTRHKKIHILSEQGLEQADWEIPFYVRNEEESIRIVHAFTLNKLEDGTIQKDTIDESSIFLDQFTEDWNILKFSLPNVKVGSIIDLKYVIISRRPMTPKPWYFQSDIPTLLSDFTIDASNVVFHFHFVGSMSKNLEIENNNHFILRNVPAIKNEPYTTTLEDNMQRMYFVMESYYYRGQKQKVVENWEKIYTQLMDKKEGLGKIMSKGKSLGKIASKLTEDVSGDKEKIRIIYDHLNSNFKFNGEYSFLSIEKPQALYNQGEGSSADINMLMVYMLRTLGFEADPLLISTRDNGEAFESFPLITQFNHLICYLKLDGKELIIDATNPLRPYTLPARNDLNRKGWVLGKNDGRWIDIKSTYSSTLLTIANLELGEDEILRGEINHQAFDYGALDYRSIWSELDENERDDFLYSIWGEDLADGEVEKKELSNFENPNQPILISANYEGKDFTFLGQDKLFIDPMLWFGVEENPFEAEERDYPVDFGHLSQQNYMFALNIPEGYEVETIPENTRIKTLGDQLIYEYIAVQNGSRIELRSTFHLRESRFVPEMYGNLREVYEQIRLKEGEKIVLRRTVRN